MHFSIKVTEDLICPWCYISSHQLRRAITSYLSSDTSSPKSTFSLSFTAFQLDPSLPVPGIPKAEYLRQHLGSKANVDAARARVREGAAKADVIIHPTDQEACVGNTLDGHRLVWWAVHGYLDKFKANENQVQDAIEGKEWKPDANEQQKEALQLRVVDSLHRAYFVDSQDISVRSVLVSVAERAGMEHSAADAFLQSTEGEEDVKREVSEAVHKGIHGVPFVEINGHGMEGGIGEKGFLSVFKRLEEMSGSNP